MIGVLVPRGAFIYLEDRNFELVPQWLEGYVV
jgi:hypothetical protein